MTTFTETFTGREDRERVLTDILAQGEAEPGTTLVAYVDRATLTVHAVRGFPTPEPVIDATACFTGGSIHRLSELHDDGDPTWPSPLPSCTGVRAGSTQPCSLWWRRRRW